MALLGRFHNWSIITMDTVALDHKNMGRKKRSRNHQRVNSIFNDTNMKHLLGDTEKSLEACVI
jgi:hypothetical protein